MMEIVENSVAVNLTEILAELAEQYCFLKKSGFYSLEIKKAGQSQSQPDRLRSAFRLIQERNGTFFPDSTCFSLTQNRRVSKPNFL